MRSAKVAIATSVAIAPVAASGAKCWPRKSFLPRPGVGDVSIGQPISNAGRQPDQLMRGVEDGIEAEMQRLDHEAYPSSADAPSGAAQPTQSLGSGGA